MAKIYFEKISTIENKVVIPVYVDSEGESVNAYEVRIKFSDNLIFRDLNDAGSIINFWLEKPSIDEDGALKFSGVTIGGYVGKKGFLTNLIFDKKGEIGSIEALPSSKIILNDGIGTFAKLTAEKRIFEFEKAEKILESAEDKFPPEPFEIYLSKDKELFGNKYYISFQTTDKQSGIAYYEVAEEQFLGKQSLKNLNFEKTSSPYILKDQTLRSYVFVRAVDKAGNERIAGLHPSGFIVIDEIFWLLFIILAGGVFALWIKSLVKKIKKI